MDDGGVESKITLLTVTRLKELLDKAGLDRTGQKSDLQERLVNHCKNVDPTFVKYVMEEEKEDEQKKKDEKEFVVWEWKDSHSWVPYDEATTKIIEQAHIQKTATIKLTHGFFNNNGKGYEIDFKKTSQINLSSGYSRAIRRRPPIPSPTARNDGDSGSGSGSDDGDVTFWQWQGDGKWEDYDDETTKKIEKAYKTWINSNKDNKKRRITLKHSFFGQQGGYVIDLNHMIQIKNNTGYHRSIRRVVNNQIPVSPLPAVTAPSHFNPTTFSSVLFPPFPHPSSATTSHHLPFSPPFSLPMAGSPFSMSPTPLSSPSIIGFPFNTLGVVPPFATVPFPHVTPLHKILINNNNNSDSSWEYQDGDTWKAFDSKTVRVIEGMIASRTTTIPLHTVIVGILDVKKKMFTEKETGKTYPVRRVPPETIDNDEEDDEDVDEDEKEKKKEKKKKEKEKKKKKKKDDDDEDTQEEGERPGKRMKKIPSNQKELTKEQQAKIEAAAKLTSWEDYKPQPLEECVICFEKYTDQHKVVKLRCSHHFCANCIAQCYMDGYLLCPMCKTCYGVRTGTMPEGSMDVKKLPPGNLPLQGHEKVGTIVITMAFEDGIQDKEHPNPGKHYYGTMRTAYLPDNEQGNLLLRLFEKAWERRLLFQIGVSVTTGKEDSVIWNGIHMKTNTSGGPTQFGYPDDTYVERVMKELADKGVTPDCL